MRQLYNSTCKSGIGHILWLIDWSRAYQGYLQESRKKWNTEGGAWTLDHQIPQRLRVWRSTNWATPAFNPGPMEIQASMTDRVWSSHLPTLRIDRWGWLLSILSVIARPVLLVAMFAHFVLQFTLHVTCIPGPIRQSYSKLWFNWYDVEMLGPEEKYQGSQNYCTVGASHKKGEEGIHGHG